MSAASPSLCFVVSLTTAQLEDSLFVNIILLVPPSAPRLLVLLSTPPLLPTLSLNVRACVTQVSQCWCSVPAASRPRAVQSFCQSCCPVSLAAKLWRKLPKKLARRWWWTCRTPWEASAMLLWRSSCWQVIFCNQELVNVCDHALCLSWGSGHDNREPSEKAHAGR